MILTYVTLLQTHSDSRQTPRETQHAEDSVSGRSTCRDMEKPRKRLVDDVKRRASTELVAASVVASFHTVHVQYGMSWFCFKGV